MNNKPLVIFTGLALATLAALAGLTMGRGPKPEEPVAATAPVTEPEKPKAEIAALPEPEKPAEAQEPAAPEQPVQAAKPAEPEKPVAAEQPSVTEKPAEPEKPAAAEPPPEPVKTAEPPPEPAKTAEPPKLPEKPEFDTVRIEPDGQAIVAGQAKPGSEVTLKADGKEIGKGVANAEGAWVVVPEAPLAKGGHEIVVEQKAQGEAALSSEQSVAVSIPEEPNKKPMIALVEPGAATKVIQQPEPAEQEVAAVEKPPEPVKPAGTEAAKPAEPVQNEAVSQLAKPAEPVQSETVSEPAKPAEPAPGETAAKPAEPAQKEAVSEPVKPAEPGQDETAAKPAEPVETAKTDMVKPAEPVAQPEKPAGEIAATEPVKPPEEPQIAALPEPQVNDEAKEAPPSSLTMDTVDYNDKGDIVFSGRAEAGTSVRLYVDNRAVGDAMATAAGTWTYAGKQEIAPGTHDLRVDQLTPEGTVTNRIELPFLRETPEKVVALATPDANVAAGAAAETETKADMQPAPEQQEQPAVTTEPKQQEITPPETQERAAPATEPQEQAPITQQQEAAKTAEPQKEMAPATDSQNEAAATAEPQQETAPVELQKEAAVTAEPQKPRDGRVVIQPGNNLWRLSRVIYGRGVQYAVIYEANKSQIRDPDLIYPGQIFAVPNAVPPEQIDPKRKRPLTAAEGGPELQ